MNKEDIFILSQIFVVQPEELPESINLPRMMDLLYTCSAEEIFSIIEELRDSLPRITSNNIPQFSSYEDFLTVLKILVESGIEDPKYENIGYFLCPKDASIVAKKKYGENHYKLAAQLGLAKNGHPFSATKLGKMFHDLNDREKQSIIQKKLALRIPIIQQALLKTQFGLVDMENLIEEFLSHSTMIRRRSNIKELISYIMEVANSGLQHKLNNLVWGHA